MTILEYIEADPDNLGLPAMAEAGNDAGIAEAINFPRFQDGLYITREKLEVFAIEQGIAGMADVVAPDSQYPTPLRVACHSLRRVLASNLFPELQLDKSTTVAIRAGFVAGGIMTQEQDAALLALGTHHMYSVANREEWDAVAVDEVSNALAPGRGAN